MSSTIEAGAVLAAQYRTALQRWCSHATIVVTLVLALGAGAAAHEPPRNVTRELVRVQGYRGSAPAHVRIVREITLVVFGDEHRFHAAEWQRFSFEEAPGAEEAAEPQRISLQGDRPTLAKFAAARPEQRVTILAERRQGATDLFVVALDLCPP